MKDTHTEAETISIAFERTTEVFVSQLKKRQTDHQFQKIVLRQLGQMSGKNTHKELFFAFVQDACPDWVFPVSFKTP